MEGTMEAAATESEVRRALCAALRDRVRIAGAYVSLDTSERNLERLRCLAFGAESADGRELAELKALYAHAGRLLEDLAHGPVPVAGVLS
jgi:hypothetical protein